MQCTNVIKKYKTDTLSIARYRFEYGVMFPCCFQQVTSRRKEEKKDFYKAESQRRKLLTHITRSSWKNNSWLQMKTNCLGNEEIRNTKELELIKLRMKALLLEKLN